MKRLMLTLILCPLLTQAQTATLTLNGCQYQGDIQNHQPHGQGALTCTDGRIYTGTFQNGEFHGKGQYIAPNNPNIFLAPFGLRSGQVKGMVLIGNFNHGTAQGNFKVLQNGQHTFNINFEHGMVKSITLPKK